MSLEDEVNKRLSGRPPELTEDQQREIAERAQVQKELDDFIATQRKDVPFAHKIMRQANSLILPILKNFQHDLVGKFPIVKLDGGLSYELQVPKIEVRYFKQWKEYYFNPTFAFGALDYTLAWGRIYPAVHYTRKPLFGEKDNWERADYTNYRVGMWTTPFNPGYGFGQIYGVDPQIPVELWLKDPYRLQNALIKGLKNAKSVVFDRRWFPSNESPSLGGPN